MQLFAYCHVSLSTGAWESNVEYIIDVTVIYNFIIYIIIYRCHVHHKLPFAVTIESVQLTLLVIV